jgi:poly-gamma-glutamate synthesis protein (capsule biosynthesis protein)
MKIHFLGDISLNDDYIRLYKEGQNPFAEIEPVLAEADFVVGNLECMAKGDQGENELKKPRLTTTLETLNYLKNIRLKVATLAHNHVYDHLEDGFLKTTNFLQANQIKYLGAGFTPEEAAKPVILKQGDISVGLLNYITGDTNPNLPEDAGVFLNMFDIEKCKHDIMQLRSKVNHVVLLLHWGGRLEGGMFPDKYQTEIAKKLIDAGADLLIGHHSHTLQPHEIYKGKYTYYSLGNFCFSDVIIDGKALPLDKKRTNPSIILNCDFGHTEYSVSIFGITNDNDFIKNTSNTKLKKMVSNKNIIYCFLIWEIYFFYEKRFYPVIHYFFGNKRNPIKQLSKLKWKSVIKHTLGYRFLSLF